MAHARITRRARSTAFSVSRLRAVVGTRVSHANVGGRDASTRFWEPSSRGLRQNATDLLLKRNRALNAVRRITTDDETPDCPQCIRSKRKFHLALVWCLEFRRAENLHAEIGRRGAAINSGPKREEVWALKVRPCETNDPKTARTWPDW